MPSYRTCRRIFQEKQSGAKIIYRISSSRIISPLEAGLDQLHSTADGISEVDFESLETPLGIFTLHSTYRLECDFELDESNATLEAQFSNLEPAFYTPPNQGQAFSPSRSFKPSSLPSHMQAGVVIPQSNWLDFSFRRPSTLASSPDPHFKMSAYAGRSVSSNHFIPFTPPAPNTLKQHFAALGISGDQVPPFSIAPLPDDSKFVLEKSEILGVSPPFALSPLEVFRIDF
jgi:hypothetical protein